MSPIVPNDVKQVIPSASGSFCEKFLSVFALPNLVYKLVAYIWNEDGTFTDEFKADICALNCKSDDTGFPTPTVSASDGQFADKIQINWTVVPGATAYDLYRNTINSPTTATLLSGNLTVNTFEDTTVSPNSLYYYWVKAKNATQTSGFGQGDSGYAGVVSTTLEPVTDLLASHGFENGTSGPISLVWTKVSGADAYDIYRSESNDFSTATAIELNAVPTEFNPLNPPFPLCFDNGDEVLYTHSPGSANSYKKFFFWIIAKRTMSSPPASSPASNGGNGADGWVIGDGSGIFSAGGSVGGGTPSGASETYAGGYTRIWFALRGCGAGGAGGGTSRGGGGGGAPAVVVGSYVLATPVAGVSKFRVVTDPESQGTGGAGETSGTDGGETTFEYSAAGDFSDTVTIATCAAPTAGLYNAAGNGAGGTAATGSVDGVVTDEVIYDGRDGEAANGSAGGHSGYLFGDPRIPQAHFNNFLIGSSYAGFGLSPGNPGSGSKASSTGAAAATGGTGRRGTAIFVGYA